MADAFNTQTSHAELIPEYWNRNVMMAAGNMTSNGALAVAENAAASGDYPGEGDIIHFPGQRSTAMANITEGTAHEYKQFSAYERTLTINVNKGVNLPTTSIAAALAMTNPFVPLAADVGELAARNLSASLCGLYASAGLTVTGTTGANINEANIREAKRKLDIARAPLGRSIAGGRATGSTYRFLLVDPVQMDALTAITAFRDIDTLVRGNETITEGLVGRIHGFDIYLDHSIAVTTDGFKHLIAGVHTPGNPRMSSLVWAPARHKSLFSNVNAVDTPALGLRTAFQLDTKQYSEVLMANQIYGTTSVRSEWTVDVKVTDN